MRTIKRLILFVLTIGLTIAPLSTLALYQELNSSALVSNANILSYYRFSADGTDTKGLINLAAGFAPGFNPAVYGNGIDFGSGNTTKRASTTIASGSAKPLTAVQIAASHTTMFWLYLYSIPAAQKEYVIYDYSPAVDASNVIRELLMYSNGENQDFGSGCGTIGKPPSVYGNISQGLAIVNNASVNGGTSQIYCSQITLLPLQWYHIAIVYDGTSWIFYVNGFRQATVAAGGAPASVFTGANFSGLTLGGIRNGCFSDCLSAIVDDFAVFKTNLTDAQINSVATGGVVNGFNGKVQIKNGKITVKN